MTSRLIVRRVHVIAGVIGFLAILAFWTATATTELLAGPAAIALAKRAILWGMIVLAPAMAAVGFSGFRLAGGSTAPLVAAKRRRMPVIALNGLLVLVPSAVFLAGRAADGRFDMAFYAVQGLELAAGAVNIWLMGLNLRDGLALTRRRRRPRPGV